MSVVDGVSQLESEDGISLPLLEFGSQLVGGESVLIKSVLPFDSAENLQIATKTPVTGFPDELQNVLLVKIGKFVNKEGSSYINF